MRATSCVLISAALLAAGCGHNSAPTTSDDQVPQRLAIHASRTLDSEQNEEGGEVPWKASLLEGGYMFQDAQEFGVYVRRAHIVATGVLTDWNGTKGNVRVDFFFRGKINGESVPVVATGGVVRPKRDDKVLLLLALRGGQLTLHSFCGASGLYLYSDELASVVRKSLESGG